MNFPPLLVAALLGLVPSLSSAYCFSVYTPRDQLVYRSTYTPVDLSQPISAGLRSRFPNHHLVFIADESTCSEIGTQSRVGNEVANVSAVRFGGEEPRRRRDRE